MQKLIRLHASELKPVLIGIGKVVDKRAALPILQCIRIIRDAAGTVTIHGTDIESWVSYTCTDNQPGDPFDWLIPLEQFSKTSKSTKDFVEVLEEKDKVLLRTFLGTTAIEEVVAPIQDKEWPEVPDGFGKSVVLSKEFRETFLEALYCACEDPTRLVLNGVCIDVSDKNGHYLVGTNGRFLYAANSFTLDLKEPVIVPTRKFLEWTGWWNGEAELSVAKGKHDIQWLRFTAGPWNYITKAVEGNYPNWRQVVPITDPSTKLRFQPEARDAIVRAVHALPGNEGPYYSIKLQAQDGKLVLQGKNKDQPAATVPVPGVEVIGAPVTVTINRHPLSHAIRCGLTEVDVYGELNPLVFRTNRKKMVVMPIRTDGPPTTPASSAPSPEPPETTEQETKEPATEEPQPEPSTERNNTMRSEIEEDVQESNRTAPEGIDEVITELDAIRQTLKEVLNDLGVLQKSLTKVKKERRATDKEIESVRATLRELQSVRI